MKGFVSEKGYFAFIQPKLGGGARLVMTTDGKGMQLDMKLPSETEARRFLLGLDAGAWTAADDKTTREMARRLRENVARR